MNSSSRNKLAIRRVLRLTFYAGVIIPVIMLSHSSGTSRTAGAAPSPLAASQREDQVVNIPYFIEKGDFHSTLTLNNNKPEETTATVTVFSANGDSFSLPPITLPPLEPTRFKLQDFIKDAPGDFSSGSVQVAHQGLDLDVTSQVSIVSQNGRLSFESTEVAAADFASTRLDGIAWVPDPQTQASVALTNTATFTINVTIRTGREQKLVSLFSRETRVVDLTDLMKAPDGDRAPVLVTLEHDGGPGALIATGFALNPKNGFSSNLTFVDCGTVTSTLLAGARVRFGRPSPADLGAKGIFSAPLLVTNTMHDPTQARIFVDYTIGSEARRVELKPVDLAPREVRLIELSREMARRGISGPVDDAGVDISYDGMPGTVIGRLTSYDSSKDYSFDVPVKDPLAGRGRGNGGYPWRLDNGFTTVVHLKNTLDKEVNAVVQVRYAGGSYNPDRIKLGPYQTVTIDLRQLRDAQKKDIRGGVMPKEIETGQIAWFEEEWRSMIGRAEVVNTGAGTASSFSCGGCPCGLVYSSGSMDPSSASAPVGTSSFMFLPKEMRRDCNFIQFGPYTIQNTSAWYSSNTNVVTVSSSGTETCVSPGSATITATWQTIVGI